MKGPTPTERKGLAILRKIVRTADELPVVIDTDAMPSREKEQAKAAMRWIDRVLDERPRAMRG
jgi:hypothetical protein